MQSSFWCLSNLAAAFAAAAQVWSSSKALLKRKLAHMQCFFSCLRNLAAVFAAAAAAAAAAAQVWSSSKALLMRKLGAQTGAALWQHAHGIDDRQVEPPKARKSIGADVNWGVRFDSDADTDKFLRVRFGCLCVCE
jgi:hypothetical protein